MNLVAFGNQEIWTMRDYRVLALGFLVWFQKTITGNKINKNYYPTSFKMKGAHKLWQGVLHSPRQFINIPMCCVSDVVCVSKSSQGTKSVLRHKIVNPGIHHSVLSLLKPQLIKEQSFHCPKRVLQVLAGNPRSLEEKHTWKVISSRLSSSYPLIKNLISNGTGDLDCDVGGA